MESTTNDNILVAAYGTLRKGYGNSRLVDRGNNHVGTGITVEDYRMTSSGIPFVSKNNPVSKIVVDIWKIDSNQLAQVDGLEGHPNWYRRELIDVNVNNSIMKAWLYFNEQSRGNTLIENGDYANKHR